jgi:hypothetical protein
MHYRRPLTALGTILAALTAAIAAFSAPPAPTPSAAPPDAAHLVQAKALFSEKCSACHNLPDPAGESKTRPEWQRTVNTMLGRYHASDSITPDQAAQIVDYLATFAPSPNTAGGRINGDPWATNDADVWTTMPSTSRVFNFMMPHALLDFTAVSAGTPGPAPTWHLKTVSASPDGTAAVVHLAQPNPSRFALLVDRKDQAQNLDVQVRFHIVSGKISPAVGIVFGFADSKNYSVLSYSQSRNTLSLIQIADPVHTTLQQTSLVPTSNGAATVAQVPPPSASGWHILRLLIHDGQVHGWLDRDKRISIADPSYTGGKVGLWAQGDTIAAFQDWTVDIYDTPTAQGSMGA